ncbi:hypothetical protein [Bacteroides cellulosilyticus]|uniref:hypothetical protein n=1 Tax=Bacteroides cellulosilyticus TaxID=246787 RepID=UPI0035665DCB
MGQVTTRAIPEGKRTVLHDFTNHSLKGKDDNSRAGWMSGEVRTQYDDEVRQATARRGAATGNGATTRAFDRSKQLFGANSKFRMLVFAGSYGSSVNMDSPVANMVCQVNSAGNGASFISPTTELGLLKGRYTFICFPADEKYNKWQVGDKSSNAGQIPVGLDEDFVSMKIENQDINSTNYKVDLSKFVRFGYELTVKFSVNEELGYLLFPQTELPLTISDAGSGATGRVINNGCTFDLKSQTITNYNNNTASFKDTLKIDKAGMGQKFTAVANMLMCNSSASQKLTISYPQLTVLKPAGTEGSKEDSVFTIKAGTFTTREAVKFEAGKSYTITLAIGEQVKGIIVGGVIWSPGNLDYDAATKKYFWAPTPDKAKNAREARGAWFRWFAPLPQSSSNTSSTNPISTSWSVTTPKWSGNSSNLGNYNGYYKGILNNSSLTSGTLPSSLTATSLGDPCWGMGEGWRMPTYNEIYLLCYVSPNATPSGTFTTGRNRFQNFSSYTGSWNDNITTEAARYAGIFITSSSKPNENPAAISNKSQYDGSQLFLPAAGLSGASSVYSAGTYGTYWSSTPYSGSTLGSWHANFNNGNLYPTNNYSYSRAYAFSVRCVLGDD